MSTTGEVLYLGQGKSEGALKGDPQYYRNFYWQTGYFNCAVSYRDVARVGKYIANQFKHHLKMSAKEELEELKRRNGIIPSVDGS